MDIDGTLVEEGRAPSEKVIRAIRKAREQGHLFFLCTGRAQAFLPDGLRDADFLDGFVCGTGTHICFHGKTIFNQHIPREALRAVCRFYLEQGRACLCEGEDDVYITPIDGASTVPPGLIRIDAEDVFETCFAHANITKLTVSSSLTEADRQLLCPWFTLYDMGHYFEAILNGNTKATGMEKMLAAIGVPREDSIAIGDNTNDMSMVEYAGLGVAMGNACDVLKAAADAVTATCAEDGVAKMIEDYVMTGK